MFYNTSILNNQSKHYEHKKFERLKNFPSINKTTQIRYNNIKHKTMLPNTQIATTSGEINIFELERF